METSTVAGFDSISDTYLLGFNEMDTTHDEFIHLVQKLSIAKNTEFKSLFQMLHQHTQDHFAREKELMERSDFPALSEHVAEHQRILGELERFNIKVQHGIFMYARAYVRELLPAWFNLHLATMDSALVAHLKHHYKSNEV